MQEPFAAAKEPGQRELQRNATAFKTLPRIGGQRVDIHAALHMDKAPIALIATAGSSKTAPTTKRRRVCMEADGQNRTWYGDLDQPIVHSIHRKYKAQPRCAWASPLSAVWSTPCVFPRRERLSWAIHMCPC